MTFNKSAALDAGIASCLHAEHHRHGASERGRYPTTTMRIILITGWLVAITSAFADSPATPIPLVFSNENGSDVYFTMVPAKYGKDYKIEREAFGIAYKLDAEGKSTELYRTVGWYSFEVFISRDGRYLVRMGPWSAGHEPEEKDLAVAFYQDGKLLKQYSTADLVKDKSKVVASVSHYFWLAPSPTDRAITKVDRLKLRLHLDYDNIFKLHTIDGWTYSFDATTGKIKSTDRTKG